MPNRNIQVQLPGGINTSLTPEEMDNLNALQGVARENFINILAQDAHDRGRDMLNMQQAIAARGRGEHYNIEHWNNAVVWELADGELMHEPIPRAVQDDVFFGIAPVPQVPAEPDIQLMQEHLEQMQEEMDDDRIDELDVQFARAEQFLQIRLANGEFVNVPVGPVPNNHDEGEEERRVRELAELAQFERAMNLEGNEVARRRVILDLPGGHVIEREVLPEGQWRFTERVNPGGAGIQHLTLEQVEAHAARQGVDLDIVFRQKDIERQQRDIEQNLRGLRRNFVIRTEMPEEKPARAKKAPVKKAVKKELDGFKYGGHVWPRSLTVNEQEFVDKRGWQALIKVIPELGEEPKEVELNADEEVIVSIAELADFYAMNDMAGIPGFAMNTHENEYNQSLKKHIQTISSFKRIKHG